MSRVIKPININSFGLVLACFGFKWFVRVGHVLKYANATILILIMGSNICLFFQGLKCFLNTFLKIIKLSTLIIYWWNVNFSNYDFFFTSITNIKKINYYVLKKLYLNYIKSNNNK